MKTMAKVVVTAVFLFQAWFSQAWFYPATFAEWRATRAATLFLEERGKSTEDMMLSPFISYQNAPGLFTLGNIYDEGVRRTGTWMFGIDGCECDESVIIVPSGRIYIGNITRIRPPQTSFESLVFEGDGA